MISREIGWSNLNNVTFGVIQQVNKIQKQVCCNCNATNTTTTTSSSTSTTTSTTSTSSSTTTTTTTIAPALRFTTDIVPEQQEFCLNIQTVSDGGPAINYVLDFGTGDIGSGSIPAGTGTTMSYTYPLGSYEAVMTFDTPERILTFNMNCGSFKINTITGLDYLSGLLVLNLPQNSLTTIDVSENTNLTLLSLANNLFVDAVVNNLVFPSSLQTLNLSSNQIVNFDPVNALPSVLNNLFLESNQIVTFNPSLPLPSSLTNLELSVNQIVSFNPSIALPSGLQYLGLGQNQIVTFNPSIALPNSLIELYLTSNQMTTAGYTASEPWANAMTVIPGRGDIYIAANVNSIFGTNLETILTAKGWTVNL